MRDLVARGGENVSNGLAHPHAYRAMFDAGFDLDDPKAIAGTHWPLVDCATGHGRPAR